MVSSGDVFLQSWVSSWELDLAHFIDGFCAGESVFCWWSELCRPITPECSQVLRQQGELASIWTEPQLPLKTILIDCNIKVFCFLFFVFFFLFFVFCFLFFCFFVFEEGCKTSSSYQGPKSKLYVSWRKLSHFCNYSPYCTLFAVLNNARHSTCSTTCDQSHVKAVTLLQKSKQKPVWRTENTTVFYNDFFKVLLENNYSFWCLPWIQWKKTLSHSNV